MGLGLGARVRVRAKVRVGDRVRVGQRRGPRHTEENCQIATPCPRELLYIRSERQKKTTAKTNKETMATTTTHT